MAIYELVRKPGELEDEAEEYPSYYSVHSNSFLAAATLLVRAVAKAEKDINVDNLTINDILGMVS